jgi:hypothetical protein
VELVFHPPHERRRHDRVSLWRVPNAWPLDLVEPLLRTLKGIDELVKAQGFAEQSLPR